MQPYIALKLPAKEQGPVFPCKTNTTKFGQCGNEIDLSFYLKFYILLWL